MDHDGRAIGVEQRGCSAAERHERSRVIHYRAPVRVGRDGGHVARMRPFRIYQPMPGIPRVEVITGRCECRRVTPTNRVEVNAMRARSQTSELSADSNAPGDGFHTQRSERRARSVANGGSRG